MNDNVSWLVTCPCSDNNFKLHVEYATPDEIREAIRLTEGKPNTKTKLKALQSALKRKERGL